MGIGVKFDRPVSPPLFESLLSLAQPSNQPKSPDASQLLEFTLTQGKEVLQATVWNFLLPLEQRLLEAAEAAKSNTAQAAFFEAVHTLQRHQARLEPVLEACFSDKARLLFSNR